MSNKTNKDVPKLRFSEFAGDWQEKRLEKLFSEFKSGFNITSEDISEHGTYPVFGGNGIRGYVESFTHDGFYLLIGRQGALCGNINRINGKAYISEHAIACKANDQSNTEWLAQRLDYYNLNRLSESSAQPGLSVNKLLRFKLFIPSIAEQEKIASFLGAIDTRLTQLRRKHKLLQTYKRGVMQKIFSQEVRFKGAIGGAFPDWQKKKLGELFKWIRTNSLSRESLSYEFGTVQNIHYGDIHKKFKSQFRLSKEEVPYINDEILVSNLAQEDFCKIGDLVIADASEDYADIGKAVEIVEVEPSKLVAGLHCFIARPKEKMIVGYSGYLVQSEDARKQIKRIAQGVSVLGISKTNLENINLPYPCIEEQEKIADFLTAIDQKIEAVARQVDRTEQFKKGLLQKMFV